MQLGFLIGLGGGLASALLFYSAARGSPLLSTLLLLLTPLPTLLAGLGWGWLPAAAGAVAGSLVMAVAASAPFAVGYFLALGLPAALASHLAYLSRPDPAGPQHARVVSGRPAAGGHVALRRRAAGAGAAADRRQLRGPARAHGPSSSAACRRAHPSSACKPLSDAQIEALAEFVVTVLPGALAAYWVGHLRAQSLSGRPHRARLRPARARLAGPAGARLSAGLPAARRPGARRLVRAGRRSASPAPASPARCCSPT